MAIRKINKWWWIDFSHNHIRYRKPSPDNSRDGAEAYEAVLRQKLARGETLDRQDIKQEECEQKFKEFAWKWFETYVKTNNKPSEIYSKMSALRAHLIPYFGEIHLDKITTLRIEQYKAKKIKEGLANKTVNNHLTVLSSCLRTAEDWVNLKKLPKIKWLKIPPYDIDFLSPEESERLLAHSQGMWREIILMALKTGLRRGELQGLTWLDINLNNKTLTVRHSWSDNIKVLNTPKSNKMRHIPLTNDLYEVLLQKKVSFGFVFPDESGQRFSGKRLNNEIRKACSKAGIRQISCHTLRHTFASHLVMKGAPLKAIQELLGHADIQTTMRYAHISPSSLKAAMDLLEPTYRPSENFGHYTVNAEQELVRVGHTK